MSMHKAVVGPKMDESAEVVSNMTVDGGYRTLTFLAPGIAASARPGQFVHVSVPDKTLRRPISIYNVQDGLVSIFFKVVGEGTSAMAGMPVGARCSILGPLGNPFSMPSETETPVILAGGYGAAATYLLARRSPKPGTLLLGARTSNDLVLTREYDELGFKVETATEDGTAGLRGLVTELAAPSVKAATSDVQTRFYACGPWGMVKAVSTMLLDSGMNGEMSVDKRMCCGVGACFACVVKIKDSNSPKGWSYQRSCKEGPVFKASSLWLD